MICNVHVFGNKQLIASYTVLMTKYIEAVRILCSWTHNISSRLRLWSRGWCNV